MGEFVVDRTPPPDRGGMRGLIRALKVDESLLAPGRPLRSVQTTVSHVRREFPERRFTTAMTGDGPRVWRLKDEEQCPKD